MSQVAHQAVRAYPGFSIMKRLGVFKDGMLVHCMVTPSIKFVGNWVETEAL